MWICKVAATYVSIGLDLPGSTNIGDITVSMAWYRFGYIGAIRRSGEV